MSEHTHQVPLTFLPGVKPRKVELTHRHAQRPEEPHRHRVTVAIRSDPATTLKERS